MTISLFTIYSFENQLVNLLLKIILQEDYTKV